MTVAVDLERPSEIPGGRARKAGNAAKRQIDSKGGRPHHDLRMGRGRRQDQGGGNGGID